MDYETIQKYKEQIEASDIRSIDDQELEEQYVEMLNDCYGEVTICNYVFDTSEALKQLDPIAYSVGFSDYTSSQCDEQYYELGDAYYPQDEVDALIEELQDKETKEITK